MTMIYSANKTKVSVPIGCPETSVSSYHHLLHNKPEERRSPFLKVRQVRPGAQLFPGTGEEINQNGFPWQKLWT
jgi:hypothetical protein